MKEKVEFERFSAKDKHGRIHHLIGYQVYITYAPVYGQPVVLKGDIEYWTDTGLPVRKIDERTFRVSASKETITRFVEKFTSFGNSNEFDVYACNRYEPSQL